jgi:hypothetical protein
MPDSLGVAPAEALRRAWRLGLLVLLLLVPVMRVRVAMA